MTEVIFSVGARADFAVLDADYFTVTSEEILSITSALTVVGGRPVHSTGAIEKSAPYREMDRALPVS